MSFGAKSIRLEDDLVGVLFVPVAGEAGTAAATGLGVLGDAGIAEGAEGAEPGRDVSRRTEGE